MDHAYWLLTWTTYGTRLPGDRRGFVSAVRARSGRRERHNVPGTELDRNVPALRRSAHRLLRQRPVRLSAEQARAALEEFCETARVQQWRLLAVAVMANHVHAVVGLPPPGDSVAATGAIGRFKAYASRRLNRDSGRRVEWWTQGGSRRLLRGEPAVGAAVRYVAEQSFCLALEIDEEWEGMLAP